MKEIFGLIMAVFGYLSGSVLYAELFMKLFHKTSLMEISENHNPGTSNAFHHGGFWCGILTVIGDLAKGILPVICFSYFAGQDSILLALIMVTPVVGHGYSYFYHFQGGMCIATGFGVLIGLLPTWEPIASLIVLYLVILLIPRMHNSIRTILVFSGLSLICAAYYLRGMVTGSVLLGVIGISIVVYLRMKVDLNRRGITIEKKEYRR